MAPPAAGEGPTFACGRREQRQHRGVADLHISLKMMAVKRAETYVSGSSSSSDSEVFRRRSKDQLTIKPSGVGRKRKQIQDGLSKRNKKRRKTSAARRERPS
ncbi:hypothetical protein ZWY2020_008700 [Hordeum vulgare]|nr:hypothetical protein ZWY2020_008700 [Hordeum vulgare]